MTLGRTNKAKSVKADIQFHSDDATGANAHPAIKVKVYHVSEVNAPEDARMRAWDEAARMFWEQANEIARNRGYSGVFSEGRSNGWLVPFTQHDATGKLVTNWTGQGGGKGYPVFPDVTDAKERRTFLTFRADIEGLLRDSIDTYKAIALQYAGENEERPRTRITLELPADAAAKLAAMTPEQLAELSKDIGVTVERIETRKPE